MEELLLALLHFLFELLFDILVSVPWDAAFSRNERARREHGLSPPSNAPILFAAALTGLVLGFMSLAVWPHTLLKLGWMRMLNLVLAPALSAALAFHAAKRRTTRGDVSNETLHAWFAALLSLMFVLIRFTWGVRAA
jgi:hypothetical protein